MFGKVVDKAFNTVKDKTGATVRDLELAIWQNLGDFPDNLHGVEEAIVDVLKKADDGSFLVKEAFGGGDMDEMPWTKWEDDKKKRLIKLICKVKGKTYRETKEVQDIKITAKDIKLLAEKVLGIEVITENIKF